MPPSLEIVVPVFNEARVLAANVRRLHGHARAVFADLEVRITVADSASTDATPAIARELEAELEGVRVVTLAAKGRGRALREAWGTSGADVLAYMDADLSTDLAALEPLVRPLLAGEADIAIGSRRVGGARVQRSVKRELVSRAYNLLLGLLLDLPFADAQCGFKAGRAKALLPLLEEVRNQNWFFDTELLFLAERRGLRVVELPVAWDEDRESTVRLLATVREDLAGIRRLRRGRVENERGGP